jgi:integrase
MRMQDITPAAIRSWHAERVVLSGATQAGNGVRFLRAVLRQAVQDEIIDRANVPSDLAVTSTGREQRVPTLDELGKLVSAMPDRLRLFVVLGVATGARRGEIAGLRRQDLAWNGERYVLCIERKVLRINRRWVVDEPKSASGTRQVAPASWVTPFVDEHMERHVEAPAESLLFRSGGDGEFIDQAYRRAWDTARDTAGVPRTVKFHQLRHFYGTAIAAGGASQFEIKEAMGHASIQSSLPYIHLAAGASAAVAELIPALPPSQA